MAAKGFIVIDTETCKGCALCVTACPPKITAIELDKETTNAKGYYPAKQINDLCIGCAACALVCPDACITVYRQKKN